MVNKILLLLNLSAFITTSVCKTIGKSSLRQYLFRNHGKNEQELCSPNYWHTLPYWNCEFDVHGCGIYNQPNMGSYFSLIKSESEAIYGKRGILLVDTESIHSSGARLITPYFPTNGCRYGCFTIEYMMCGDSPNILYIIQQDSDNYCLYQRNHHTRVQRWTNASVTVEFANGKPRFFVETRFNYGVLGYGFVAISNMNFHYGVCERDDGNYCGLNPSIQTQNTNNNI